MEQVTYIKHLLKAIANSGKKDILFQAEVIDIKNNTCTIKEGNITYENIFLLAAMYNGNDTLLIKPKIGSIVLVADTSEGERRNMVILGHTAIDEIIIHGGKNGGIPIGSKLAEWMNNVANDLATLQQLLLTSPIAGNGAPAAIQFVPKTQSITTNDIENTKVKH